MPYCVEQVVGVHDVCIKHSESLLSELKQDKEWNLLAVTSLPNLSSPITFPAFTNRQ